MCALKQLLNTTTTVVLVVDGKFAGELNDVIELLAYAYHTGENYTDRDDLEMKYYEHLDFGNERWEFLP